MNICKTKILFVSNVSVLGGAERTLVDILKFLDRNRYVPHLATGGTGELERIALSYGVPVVKIPSKRLKRSTNLLYLTSVVGNILLISLQLVHYIRQNKIAIIHANNDSSMLYSGLTGRLTGTPCIWHCRDLAKLGFISRVLCRYATKIIAISNCVAEYLYNNIPEIKRQKNKLIVIRNGIDMEQTATHHLYGPDVRHELGIRNDEIIICTLGQLVPWKKHPLFLEAAALIACKIPSVRFVITGGDLFHEHPDYLNKLQIIIQQLHLENKVIFTGYRHDALRILAASDILMHTADREPFGRSIIEAMALGKPVVAVNSCGPSEIIRNEIDGLLVEPDNARSLAEAAIRLIRDRNLSNRLGDSARKRVTVEFDAKRMVAELESVYAELDIFHNSTAERQVLTT